MSEQNKVVSVDERVLKWLLGECAHPVTREWFERPDGRKGAFWWRKELRETMLAAAPSPEPVERPRIVCLCGSTKFRAAFEAANKMETLAGRMVLSVGCFMHADAVPITPEQKINLDVLHKRKIDLADEIYVLNVGGYIGDSTKSEVRYAQEKGKSTRWLEPENANLSL